YSMYWLYAHTKTTGSCRAPARVSPSWNAPMWVAPARQTQPATCPDLRTWADPAGPGALGTCAPTTTWHPRSQHPPPASATDPLRGAVRRGGEDHGLEQRRLARGVAEMDVFRRHRCLAGAQLPKGRSGCPPPRDVVRSAHAPGRSVGVGGDERRSRGGRLRVLQIPSAHRSGRCRTDATRPSACRGGPTSLVLSAA